MDSTLESKNQFISMWLCQVYQECYSPKNPWRKVLSTYFFSLYLNLSVGFDIIAITRIINKLMDRLDVKDYFVYGSEGRISWNFQVLLILIRSRHWYRFTSGISLSQKYKGINTVKPLDPTIIFDSDLHKIWHSNNSWWIWRESTYYSTRKILHLPNHRFWSRSGHR